VKAAEPSWIWVGQFQPNVNSGLSLFLVNYIPIQIQVLIFQNSFEIHINSEFDKTLPVSYIQMFSIGEKYKII
jgi:hypothetical protein